MPPARAPGSEDPALTQSSSDETVRRAAAGFWGLLRVLLVLPDAGLAAATAAAAAAVAAVAARSAASASA